MPNVFGFLMVDNFFCYYLISVKVDWGRQRFIFRSNTILLLLQKKVISLVSLCGEYFHGVNVKGRSNTKITFPINYFKRKTESIRLDCKCKKYYVDVYRIQWKNKWEVTRSFSNNYYSNKAHVSMFINTKH